MLTLPQPKPKLDQSGSTDATIQLSYIPYNTEEVERGASLTSSAAIGKITFPGERASVGRMQCRKDGDRDSQAH